MSFLNSLNNNSSKLLGKCINHQCKRTMSQLISLNKVVTFMNEYELLNAFAYIQTYPIL